VSMDRFSKLRASFMLHADRGVLWVFAFIVVVALCVAVLVIKPPTNEKLGNGEIVFGKVIHGPPSGPNRPFPFFRVKLDNGALVTTQWSPIIEPSYRGRIELRRWRGGQTGADVYEIVAKAE
jgi:hypothetical protein